MRTKKSLRTKGHKVITECDAQSYRISVFTLKQWFGRGIEGTAHKYGHMKYVVGTWVEYPATNTPECLATVSMHRNRREATMFLNAARADSTTEYLPDVPRRK